MPAEVETMAYFGEVPWHGLGTKLENIATAKEAIAAAGLDWEVELVSISVRGKVLPDFHAVERTKDRKVYTIVRNRFAPIQNSEAFDLFDDVVGTKEAMYHTAGSLREGARVWILAKLNEALGVKGEQIDKYVCLLNSHDGSSALQMFWTPVRVVCLNTLQMALSKASNKFYTRHTTRYRDRIGLAKEILGMANTFYTDWSEKAKYLASTQLPAAEVPLLLNRAFALEEAKDEYEKVWKPTLEAMNKVKELVEVGRGMDNPDIRGTKWAYFNAVAEYVDYYKKPRGSKEGARLNQAWFGSGADMKERAWNYLIKK